MAEKSKSVEEWKEELKEKRDDNKEPLINRNPTKEELMKAFKVGGRKLFR